MEQSVPTDPQTAAQRAAHTEATHAPSADQAARFAHALHEMLDPWHQAIADPVRAQEAVLRRILPDYERTAYGAAHGAAEVAAASGASGASSASAVSSAAAGPPEASDATATAEVAAAAGSAASLAALVAEYRRAFPVMTYDDYKPLIQQVMAGDIAQLLCEEPLGWAITRGTTADEPKRRLKTGVSPTGHTGGAQDKDAGSVNSSAIGATEDDALGSSASPAGRDSVLRLPVKFIPMTPTDLRMRVSAGRAMMAYVAATKRMDLFAGVNLNLNFPSVVGTVAVGDRQIEYGYSSGIYTKHVSKLTPIRSVPSQEEIDQLSPGTTRAEWDARFELAIEKCRSENVTLVGGVCQTAIEFGRYLSRKHKVYPKDLWKTQIMTLGSTPGINTRHAARLRAMWGPVAIREIYGATEGMFGQQLDEQRAWVPNYDLFFFEVETRSGIKMLHEMRPGETGSLVVSTPILARYRIGDTILALPPPYFRCIGRDGRWTRAEYWWREIGTLNLSRL